MDEPISQTGVIAEAAVQPDLIATQSQPQVEQEQMVPVSALQAERRERQKLQENQKLLQDHLALMQANAPKQQAAPADDFSGLSDNDVLTVGEFKKIAFNFQRKSDLERMEEKIARQHQDYDEVVRKYLPEVLKQDPDLVEALKTAPNPYKVAYHLAKRSDSYLQDQRTTNRSPEAQKAVQNLQRPGNLSSIGAGSSGVPHQNYKSMSEADFMKMANKNLGYS